MKNQTASAPANSIDVAADLIATGKQFWDPVCSQFESMGKMNSMPIEMEGYVSRREWAAKFEQFNEAIEMEAHAYKKWQKGCYIGCCPFFIIPCCLLGGMAMKQRRMRKVADNVKHHAKVVFDSWKEIGIEVIFIPGKRATAGGGNIDMYDNPNIIRILFPPGAVVANNTVTTAVVANNTVGTNDVANNNPERLPLAPVIAANNTVATNNVPANTYTMSANDTPVAAAPMVPVPVVGVAIQ